MTWLDDSDFTGKKFAGYLDTMVIDPEFEDGTRHITIRRYKMRQYAQVIHELAIFGAYSDVPTDYKNISIEIEFDELPKFTGTFEYNDTDVTTGLEMFEEIEGSLFRYFDDEMEEYSKYEFTISKLVIDFY